MNINTTYENLFVNTSLRTDGINDIMPVDACYEWCANTHFYYDVGQYAILPIICLVLIIAIYFIYLYADKLNISDTVKSRCVDLGLVLSGLILGGYIYILISQ